uniref:alpha-1,2-Mannosidase n=1 Tax=Hirondellea gigas TaxID=1518452 RepID=A0A6A7G4Y3_9CRUS
MHKFSCVSWPRLLCFAFLLICLAQYTSGQLTSDPMTEEERLFLKEEAREMFYHAYDAYMANAYPADELLPLSCAGRYRDPRASRGDIDDVLGNFSLTLIDSLDTLVLLGDLPEFEKAVKLIIRDVTFDTDVIVSVFETNIRVLGGLLSGHVLAEHINQLYGVMSWYGGELLVMAKDIADRLLPAFNTTTGIPHPRVNLRHGMNSPQLVNSRDTCTACAGTMILEFASLSRLTGHSIYEDKARQTMDYLWQQRHRGSDLVGTILNVHSGDWVRRDSGVGAGIDSYYEYLFKAYVLFGDYDYLYRFNKHYSAVMKYISQGPMLLDVHMHRPQTTTRNYMDAFLAFWPGLQVLKGDIKPAIETHEMLYQVIQRHNFLPEAFTTDFQVHWGQHPLRPEFVESTYLLYEATEDPYYLRVGREVLKSLQQHAWVPCGYAAVKDVRTGGHEDRMDSFVLTETFKYLYLLFSKPDELPINLDDFVFTTEAHLLPLSLAPRSGSNMTTPPLFEARNVDPDGEFSMSCPNAHSLFPGKRQFAENIRKPMKNFVDSVCPSRNRGSVSRKLKAQEFQAGNQAHEDMLRNMGITILRLPDGKVQLQHSSAAATSNDDSDEGLLFMQEMIELSKAQQQQPDHPPKAVIYATYVHPDDKLQKAEEEEAAGSKMEDNLSEKSELVGENLLVTTLMAGPAQFGLTLSGDVTVNGELAIASPYRACNPLTNHLDVKGKIVLLERGDCMFIQKARMLQLAGAKGGIVVDNNENKGTGDDADPVITEGTPPLFAMSGDSLYDGYITIPMVFLFSTPAQSLLEAYNDNGKELSVFLTDYENSGIANMHKSLSVSLDGASDPLTVSSHLQLILSSQSKDGDSQQQQQHGVKGEGSCSDDLVTLVGEVQGANVMAALAATGAHDNTPAAPAAPIKNINAGEHNTYFKYDELSLDAFSCKAAMNSEDAKDLLFGIRRFISLQKASEDPLEVPYEWLLHKVQRLLQEKGSRNPLLLRSLLASHLPELVLLLQDTLPAGYVLLTTEGGNINAPESSDSEGVSDATGGGGEKKDPVDDVNKDTRLINGVVQKLLEVLVLYSGRPAGAGGRAVREGTSAAQSNNIIIGMGAADDLDDSLVSPGTLDASSDAQSAASDAQSAASYRSSTGQVISHAHSNTNENPNSNPERDSQSVAEAKLLGRTKDEKQEL